MRAELGLPDGTPLPSPLPAGLDIAKKRIVWFEILDDYADRLQTPLSNWISRASTKSTSEESSQVMGARYRAEMVVGESELKKFLTQTLYVTDFSVLALEQYAIAINDPLDQDYNCESKLYTYEKFVWGAFNIAINKAKIEGVSITRL